MEDFPIDFADGEENLSNEKNPLKDLNPFGKNNDENIVKINKNNENSNKSFIFNKFLLNKIQGKKNILLKT